MNSFDWKRQSPFSGNTFNVNGTIEVYEDGSLLVRPEASSVTVGTMSARDAARMARLILAAPCCAHGRTKGKSFADPCWVCLDEASERVNRELPAELQQD